MVGYGRSSVAGLRSSVASGLRFSTAAGRGGRDSAAAPVVTEAFDDSGGAWDAREASMAAEAPTGAPAPRKPARAPAGSTELTSLGPPLGPPPDGDSPLPPPHAAGVASSAGRATPPSLSYGTSNALRFSSGGDPQRRPLAPGSAGGSPPPPTKPVR